MQTLNARCDRNQSRTALRESPDLQLAELAPQRTALERGNVVDELEFAALEPAAGGSAGVALGRKRELNAQPLGIEHRAQPARGLTRSPHGIERIQLARLGI